MQKACHEESHALFLERIAAFAAQGIQFLVRNAATQNTPDIQVSGVFRLAERTYGDYTYRSAHLYLFEKPEFSYFLLFFSICKQISVAVIR